MRRSSRYIVKDKKFLSLLGEFVTNNVISYIDKKTNRKFYRSEVELNNLNRFELAYAFYEKYVNKDLLGTISKEDLIEDIAVFIDKRIPPSYIKYRFNLKDSPKYIKVDDYENDLNYHFKENIKL